MSYMTELFGAAFDENRRIPELDEALASISPTARPIIVAVILQLEQRIRSEQHTADAAIEGAKATLDVITPALLEKYARIRAEEQARCAAIARKMGETEPGLSARHMGKAIAKAIEEGK